MSALTEKVSQTEIALHLARTDAKLSEQFNAAADLIEACFRAGGKLLVCGNGGSAAQAQHFVAELTGRYLRDRPPLPAVALTTDTSALTAIGNDLGFERVFSRGVAALGNASDVLLAISTSGSSPNVLRAIKQGRIEKMSTIGLTGSDGGNMSGKFYSLDCLLCVPATDTPTVQELHLVLLHALAGELERRMFG
jgi:D-sedoheptulose 7-phosphate isomerase